MVWDYGQAVPTRIRAIWVTRQERSLYEDSTIDRVPGGTNIVPLVLLAIASWYNLSYIAVSYPLQKVYYIRAFLKLLVLAGHHYCATGHTSGVCMWYAWYLVGRSTCRRLHTCFATLRVFPVSTHFTGQKLQQQYTR